MIICSFEAAITCLCNGYVSCLANLLLLSLLLPWIPCSDVKLAAASAAFSVVLYGIEFLPETGIFCDWKREFINVTSDVIIVWGSNAFKSLHWGDLIMYFASLGHNVKVNE
jgi:hypothetical protein